jgi:hypothetical protein
MKYTFISVMFLTAFCSSVYGQNGDNENKFDYYISAGIAYSDVYLPILKSYNYSNGVTGKIGPSVSYRLSNKFSIQADIMFLYSKMDLRSPNTAPFAPIAGQSFTDFKQKIYMINLPIKARYYMADKWYAALGPSIDFQIDAESSKYSKWFSGIGLNVELGYTISNSKKFNLEIAPDFYLSNVVSFDERPLYYGIKEEPIEMHVISFGMISRYRF